MGAPKRITRETILQSAFTLLCKEGYEALNARSLARKMGGSTQPIYAAFGRMDALKKSLKELAEEKYIKSTRRELESGKYNAYKSYGVGFVRFAREEKQLFRYLYMRGRSGEKLIEDVNLPQILEALQSEYGYDEQRARKFHEDMSVYSYGLAMLVNTGFSTFSDEEISECLQRQFMALTGVYGIPPKWKGTERGKRNENQRE